MPQPFRAVIFDLDGVLADSEPWWNEIDAKLLSEYGVTYRGEYHREVLGMSYQLAIEFYKKAFGIRATDRRIVKLAPVRTACTNGVHVRADFHPGSFEYWGF